jgi:hypothetical protein
MLSFTDLALTVEEADAYATSRAWTNWTGADVAKEAALRRGQDYVAVLYNARWATRWDNDDAPEPVKYAIVEAARRELVSPGSLLPDVTPGSVKKAVAVSGAVSVTYAVGDDVAASMRPVLAAISGLLVGLVTAESGTSVTTLARF